LVDLPILQQQAVVPFMDSDNLPHIGRISPDIPIVISSEADVDVFLSFAQIVTEQQLRGFSWDTCVDIALVEAGLYEYWRDGFRQINNAAREQALLALATNYTMEELAEMGVFYRHGMLEEFQSIGFFNYEAAESLIMANAIITPQPLNVSRTIPRVTLQFNRWQSSFQLFAGDRISYSFQHRQTVDRFPSARFATGVSRPNSSQRYQREYVTAYNQMSTSRTINKTSTNPFGAESFSIVPGGENPFEVSNGRYSVTW